MKNRQGEDTAMEREQDMEYKDLIYKSFKPAYLFSRVLGVMPLSYKRKRTLKFREAHKRTAPATQFVWSWQSAIYSGLWIVLHIAINYWFFHGRQPHPPPEVKANSQHADLSSGNFSENGTSRHPPLSNTRTEMWIGSMSGTFQVACTILVLILGIFGARKIPEIIRQLHQLDDNADEDGYTFLGRKGFFSTRIYSFCLLSEISSL
jgi:hypothetical protein